jgi:hypothetical protein
MTDFVTPNLFTLSGHHLHISYASSGIDGKPHFTYQDAHQTLSFSGDQITTTSNELGTIVSVRTRMTIDSGSTTFSVLIPRVRLAQGTTAPIHTLGIAAIHRFSMIPAFNVGQQDSYTQVALTGTAQQVIF